MKGHAQRDLIEGRSLCEESLKKSLAWSHPRLYCLHVLDHMSLYAFVFLHLACRSSSSVRAFRASVQNEVYVRDVIEQREKRRREEEERIRREKELAKINPFSVRVGRALRLGACQPFLSQTSNAGALAAATGHSNLGASLFGAAAPASNSSFNPFSTSNVGGDSPAQAADALSELSVQPQPTKNAAAGPSTPSVRYGPPAPAYQPAQYITTFEEYIPRLDHPSHADRKATGVPKEQQKYLKQGGGDAVDGDRSAATGGPAEQWERVLPKGVDEVFERFLNRLNDAEGGEEQVLRWVHAQTQRILTKLVLLDTTLVPIRCRTRATLSSTSSFSRLSPQRVRPHAPPEPTKTPTRTTRKRTSSPDDTSREAWFRHAHGAVVTASLKCSSSQA